VSHAPSCWAILRITLSLVHTQILSFLHDFNPSAGQDRTGALPAKGSPWEKSALASAQT